MSGKTNKTLQPVQQERTFPCFTISQRWEHTLLLLSGLVLLLTGLPQKYREFSISQDLLSTPDRVELLRQIHHIAAIVLAVEAVYHLGMIIYLMAKRRLPGDLLRTWQHVRDAGHMIQYLLFMRSDKPKFVRYNFEQKVTYWFIFFGILINYAAHGLAEMSRSFFALDNDTAAGRAWYESLRIATEIHGTPVALYALIGLASLLAKRGDMERALETTLMISNHPAGSQDSRNRAARLRIELESQLTPQQIEAAQARAQAKTFEDVVDEVLK